MRGALLSSLATWGPWTLIVVWIIRDTLKEK